MTVAAPADETVTEHQILRSKVIQAAVAAGLMDKDDLTLAAFMDLAGIEENISVLTDSFPGQADVLHAFASKANPLPPLLKVIREAGMGCEVASPGELGLAVASGFSPDQIVFDAPAKRSTDIRRALELGVKINVDNLAELDSVAGFREQLGSTSEIGVRVNPVIGAGTIASTSTASATSKFGVPISEGPTKERLIEAFVKYPWLSMLHVHTGSQGMGMDLVSRGIEKVVDFADEVDAAAGRQQIHTIDIGGGLTVDFTQDAPAHGRFPDYVSAVVQRVPRLFDGSRKIITEFGRSIVAKHGFTASFVESTKQVEDRSIALTYAGANVAARTVYQPETWPLRVRALDSSGAPKTGVAVPQDIAGPLCFAGDVVASQCMLPQLAAGDLVLLLDTGGYYASAPYGYNSMPQPGVYGYRFTEDGEVEFTVLRKPESVEELVARALA